MSAKITKKVYERTLEDYREQAWGDARCNWCMNQWGWNVKSSRFNEICPEYRYTRLFAYSGMGKFHIIRELLEGDLVIMSQKSCSRSAITARPAAPAR